MNLYIVLASFVVEAENEEDAYRVAANEAPSDSVIECVREVKNATFALEESKS